MKYLKSGAKSVRTYAFLVGVACFEFGQTNAGAAPSSDWADGCNGVYGYHPQRAGINAFCIVISAWKAFFR